MSAIKRLNELNASLKSPGKNTPIKAINKVNLPPNLKITGGKKFTKESLEETLNRPVETGLRLNQIFNFRELNILFNSNFTASQLLSNPKLFDEILDFFYELFDPSNLPTTFVNYFHFKKVGPNNEALPYDEKFIPIDLNYFADVNFDIEDEIGPTQHKFHLHITFQCANVIIPNALVFFDEPKMYREFYNRFQNNCMIRSRPSPGASLESMRRVYNKKDKIDMKKFISLLDPSFTKPSYDREIIMKGENITGYDKTKRDKPI